MDALLATLAVVVAFGLAWTNLLLVRPAVARARLRREATEIRNEIVDAVLDGHVRRDDQAVHEVLGWIHMLTHHATEVGWSKAASITTALKDLGIRPDRPVLSYNKMTPEGRRVLIDAERRLDRVVARYFVDGSRLWWLLAPARFLWRALNRVSHPRTPEGASPEGAAKRVRKASSNPSDAVASSVKAWLGPEETRHVAV